MKKRAKYKCPKCNSIDVGFERSSGYVGFRCYTCNHWEYEENTIKIEEEVVSMDNREFLFGNQTFVTTNNPDNRLNCAGCYFQDVCSKDSSYTFAILIKKYTGITCGEAGTIFKPKAVWVQATVDNVKVGSKIKISGQEGSIYTVKYVGNELIVYGYENGTGEECMPFRSVRVLI